MAIIGKIRKHSGLTIVFVGVALLAFILGDLSKRGYSGNENNVGKIAGENITYIEFERAVQEQLDLAKANRPDQPITAEETQNIRNQVWNTYVEDITFGNQYEKLGVTVTEDEKFDLIAGENPHQYIVYNFSDPQTGQVNKEQVLNLMSNLDQLEPDAQMQISNLITLMVKDVLRTKYRNLLNKGYYAPAAFAKLQYEKAHENVSIDVAQLPYSAIVDSTITITDADYQKYYNEHKEAYKQNESRKIEYVIFDVKPSEGDFAASYQAFMGLYNELTTISDIDVPLFINSNTDGVHYDSIWHPLSYFPANVSELLSANTVGTTIAPYQDGESFFTARLMGETMRSDTMDAEHVLIAYKGAFRAPETVVRSKEQAQKTADSIADVAKKNTAPINILAMMYSDDPGKTENFGNYPRFADGTMVGEFNEAVQKGKEGDIVVVETVFGYHVIKVGKKNPPQKMLRVAMLKRDILPSDATMQVAYANATKLASESTGIDAFRENANKENYNLREMDRIDPMNNNLQGIQQSRVVIRWAYNKNTKVGDVSNVFSSDNQYQFVVAALSAIHPKGYATVEDQKQVMQNAIIRDKKGDMIIAKVQGQTGTDIHEIATKFDGVVTDAPIQVNFNTMSLPNNFGREQEVIGTALALNEGEFRGPIKGFNGVYFIKAEKRTLAEPKENYNEERQTMQTGFASRASLYQKVLQDKANIKDNRVLFY